jgi:hypothetical protein
VALEHRNAGSATRTRTAPNFTGFSAVGPLSSYDLSNSIFKACSFVDEFPPYPIEDQWILILIVGSRRPKHW